MCVTVCASVCTCAFAYMWVSMCGHVYRRISIAGTDCCSVSKYFLWSTLLWISAWSTFPPTDRPITSISVTIPSSVSFNYISIASLWTSRTSVRTAPLSRGRTFYMPLYCCKYNSWVTGEDHGPEPGIKCRHTHTWTHLLTDTLTSKHTNTQTHTHSCTHSHTHTHMHIYVHFHSHSRSRKRMRTCTRPNPNNTPH